jgi:hypothetical protein
MSSGEEDHVKIYKLEKSSGGVAVDGWWRGLQPRKPITNEKRQQEDLHASRNVVVLFLFLVRGLLKAVP